jgi:DNA-binding transcriptional LysR family regulator
VQLLGDGDGDEVPQQAGVVLASTRVPRADGGSAARGSAEWVDPARRVFGGHDIEIASAVPLAVGGEGFGRIMAELRNPILAVVDFPVMPKTVLRPLAEPVPLSPVSLVWRKGLVHPQFDALRRAARGLSDGEGWPRRPPEGWISAIDEPLVRSIY